jgi:hypothetical protein
MDMNDIFEWIMRFTVLTLRVDLEGVAINVSGLFAFELFNVIV